MVIRDEAQYRSLTPPVLLQHKNRAAGMSFQLVLVGLGKT